MSQMDKSAGQFPSQSYGYVIAGGRYIEGTSNCPLDTVRLLAAGGQHLLADVQIRHLPPASIPEAHRFSIVR